jgi:hypothetical protein
VENLFAVHAVFVVLGRLQVDIRKVNVVEFGFAADDAPDLVRNFPPLAALRHVEPVYNPENVFHVSLRRRDDDENRVVLDVVSVV